MNILLISHRAETVDHLKMLVAETAGTSNVAACFPGLEVAEITVAFIPDLVVFEAGGHIYGCLQIIEHLLKVNERTYILLMAEAHEQALLEEALQAGVEDFIAGSPCGGELQLRLRRGIRAAAQKGGRSGERKNSRPAVQKNSLPALQQACRPLSGKTSSPFRAVPHRPGPLAAARKIGGNALFGGLMVLLALLVFFLVQSKLHGGVPMMFGHRMFVVLSGSMQPAFAPGSVVFVRPVDADTIEKGDIITFGGSGGGNPTTHRVVDIVQGENLEFTTRGDANNADDPNPVPAEKVVGKVTGSVPLLGYLVSLFWTRQYLIFLVFIPSACVILLELCNIFRYTRETGRGGKKEVIRGATPAK